MRDKESVAQDLSVQFVCSTFCEGILHKRAIKDSGDSVLCLRQWEFSLSAVSDSGNSVEALSLTEGIQFKRYLRQWDSVSALSQTV